MSVFIFCWKLYVDLVSFFVHVRSPSLLLNTVKICVLLLSSPKVLHSTFPDSACMFPFMELRMKCRESKTVSVILLLCRYYCWWHDYVNHLSNYFSIWPDGTSLINFSAIHNCFWIGFRLVFYCEVLAIGSNSTLNSRSSFAWFHSNFFWFFLFSVGWHFLFFIWLLVLSVQFCFFRKNE